MCERYKVNNDYKANSMQMYRVCANDARQVPSTLRQEGLPLELPKRCSAVLTAPSPPQLLRSVELHRSSLNSCNLTGVKKDFVSLSLRRLKALDGRSTSALLGSHRSLIVRKQGSDDVPIAIS